MLGRRSYCDCFAMRHHPSLTCHILGQARQYELMQEKHRSREKLVDNRHKLEASKALLKSVPPTSSSLRHIVHAAVTPSRALPLEGEDSRSRVFSRFFRVDDALKT
jgi:hypothetical protein